MARILVIDDDTTTLMAVRAMLERMGYEVDTAPSGAQGIERFRVAEPDIVLTDIFMPRQDGLETMRVLKSINPAARVVCISGGPERLPDAAPVRDTILRFARDFGADASLPKPLRPEAVKAVLDRLLAPARVPLAMS